ncbi:MAG: sialidase family protein [Actinomycetota bacterium]
MRTAAATALIVLLFGTAAFGELPEDRRLDPRLVWLLDMEHNKPRVPKGVTPAAARLSPKHAAGGRALVHRAGAILKGAPTGSSRLHRLGVGAGEPTLGVTKKGTIFYQAFDGPPIVMRSTDGGRKWKDVSPTIGDRKRHPETLDPYLWVDYDTGRVFTYDFFFGCSELSWTDDEGETWTTTLLNCGLQDHQNLFTGPPVTSPTVGYPNIVYSCSNQAGVTIYEVAAQCLKSLDGGLTWVPTGEPAYVTDMQEENDLGIPGYCHGAIGHGFAGPDGTVYIPKGLCGQPFVSISHDEGATWERVQVAKNGVPQTTIGVYEHEASVAADAEGNVYYFWMSYNRLPYLAVSRDKGQTWSKPIPVGPPNLREATLPHLTVGGPGKVAVVYYGSTNSPGKPFPQNDDCKDKMVECFSNLFFLNPPDPKSYEKTTWNGYMTVTADALSKNPTFHTATINDPDDPFVRGPCGPIRCKSVYDFIDVNLDPKGRAWGSYVDICIMSCAKGESDNTGNDAVVGTIVGGPRLR